MDSRLFLRRALVVTLTMSVVGATACVKERTGDDKVPLRGDSPVPGAAGGAMSGTAAGPEPVLSVESQQALEAGNAAFRRKDYAGALAGYEKAAKLSPEHAAPRTPGLADLQALIGPTTLRAQPDAAGPLATWLDVARAVGVDDSTIRAHRRRTRDPHRPFFGTAADARSWYAQLVGKPAFIPAARRNRGPRVTGGVVDWDKVVL